MKELRSIQIEDDEMEMSDDDRDYQTTSHSKRKRYDSDNLKEENDSLRHQLEAMRNEMSLERTDLKCNSDFREKQMKVLQETIRNMQTQLLQTKMREQKDAKTIEQLEKRLKEAGVKQLLLKTKIRQTNERLREREACVSVISESSEVLDIEDEPEPQLAIKKQDNSQIIDIDVDKSDDEVRIIEEPLVINKAAQEKDQQQLQEKPASPQMPQTGDGKNPLTEKIAINEFEPLNLDEAKLIALTTAFLLIQPCGSSTQSICAYIKTITKDTQLQESDLNKVLQKYSNIFQTNASTADPPDAKDHKDLMWKCCALIMQTSS